MRLDAAKDVLRRVLGSIDVDAKVEEIRQTLSSERPPRLADLRGSALGLLPIVWVGIGLSVFQQFVGINVIFYYSSVLWQAVGFSENSSLVITRDNERGQYRHDARRNLAHRQGGPQAPAAGRLCRNGPDARDHGRGFRDRTN